MDFVDINLWNEKITKAFDEAKVRLPSYEKELKVILDVLNADLSVEEKITLEQKAKMLKEIIDDLLTDTSLGFYLLEAQEFLEKYAKISAGAAKSISFMKKDRVVNSESNMLSKAFLELVSKYNNILQLNIPKISTVKKVTVCECGNSKDIDVVDDRIHYCQDCGTQLKEKIGSRSTFKDIDRVNISSKYKYSRLIHIQNCMKQFQGKQKVRIPPQVYRDVKSQLALNGYKKVNPQHVRTALQSTGWSDQYENFVLIWSVVTGKPCPDISHLEVNIISDFELIEREYNILMANPDEERSSFMSYPFVLYAILRRHGFKCDMNFFNMLKSDRIDWLDDTMEKIFERLEWGKFERIGE